MKKPKLSMPTILTAIALVSAIGGGAYTLDDRWARKPWVEEQFVQVQGQYASMRLNQVDTQIVQLEAEARRRPLSLIERDLLARLYRERKVLLCQLRIERC